MALTKYIPKSRTMPEDMIRITKQSIYFSTSFWQSQLNGKPFVEVYYDEETRMLGLAGSSKEGLKLSHMSPSAHRVRVNNVWKHFKLFFASPLLVKPTKREDSIWLFQLKG